MSRYCNLVTSSFNTRGTVYTHTPHSCTKARSHACIPRRDFKRLSGNGGQDDTTAWCLFIHAESSVSISLSLCPQKSIRLSAGPAPDGAAGEVRRFASIGRGVKSAAVCDSARLWRWQRWQMEVAAAMAAARNAISEASKVYQVGRGGRRARPRRRRQGRKAARRRRRSFRRGLRCRSGLRVRGRSGLRVRHAGGDSGGQHSLLLRLRPETCTRPNFGLT